VDLQDSPELLALIKSMMRTDPTRRVGAHEVYGHPIVVRARAVMERMHEAARASGASVFGASPLAGVPGGFLEEILGRGRGNGMDVCA
jgi:mitosis inhibitor protein kinase SWE1